MNDGANADTFSAPGADAIRPGKSELSVSAGGNRNGVWEHFLVADSGDLDPGTSEERGWSPRITAGIDVRKGQEGPQLLRAALP